MRILSYLKRRLAERKEARHKVKMWNAAIAMIANDLKALGK